jgi:hypothetical protein
MLLPSLGRLSIKPLYAIFLKALIFMVSHIPQFEICCSYPPACQVLFFGCSLATDAVNLIYEYHRTLAFLLRVVKQFPYQSATAEQCIIKRRLECLHPRTKVMDKIGGAF